MNDKQKRFADEYLIDMNATQACIRAGYSPKTARQQGQVFLTKLDIQNYINEQLKKMHEKTISTAEEVEAFLTRGMRQELEEEVLMVEGVGLGETETVVKKKKIGLKDSIKCAELLGKRHGLFTDKVAVEGAIPIVISGDGDLLE